MEAETAQKRVLIVNRRPPYGTSHAAEVVELILMMGVFDQKVSVLFIDDGVYQLIRDQQSEVLGFQRLSAAFDVMPQYGIDTFLVDEESLRLRNLTATDLIVRVATVSASELPNFFLSHDVFIEA